MNEKEFVKSLENSVVVSLERYNVLVEAETKLEIIKKAVKEDNSTVGLTVQTDQLISMIVKE